MSSNHTTMATRTKRLYKTFHFLLLVLMLGQPLLPMAQTASATAPAIRPATADKAAKSPVVETLSNPATNQSVGMPFDVCDEFPFLNYLPLVVGSDQNGTANQATGSEPTCNFLINTPIAVALNRINPTIETVNIVTAPLHGAATLVGQTMFYTPTNDFNGSDELRYAMTINGVTTWARLRFVVNQTNPTPIVRPILDCVTDEGNGNYRADFGYRNDNATAVTIPIGSANRFSPAPQDRGQPSEFQPGRAYRAFNVPFNGGNLVWTLNGRTATAAANSTRCTPSTPTATPTAQPSATPKPPTTICTALPFGSASAFNLFILGDADHQNTATQGQVAVAGNAVFANYAAGQSLPNSAGARDDLIVGGNLNFTNGSVYNGNVVYGGTGSLSGVNIPNGTSRQGTPLDFAASRADLQARSTTWALLPTVGTSTLQFGTLTLVGSDAELNVWSVAAADLASTSNFNVSAPAGSTALINVFGDSAQLQNMGITINGVQRERLVFNFVNATTLQIGGINVQGSVFAPRAAITFPSGEINGTLVGAALNGSGAVRSAEFVGCLPDPGTTPTTTPTATPTIDPTATEIPTATPIATSTETPTATATAVVTGTTTPTATAVVTGTTTPTPTATPTAVVTGTTTPTPTATPSPTPRANEPPTAISTTLTLDEDTVGTLNLTTLASDPNGDPLTFEIGSAPVHGSASVVGSTLMYTPDVNYNGDDALTYTVNDRRGGSAQGRIAITVRSINDAPNVALIAEPASGTAPLTVTWSAIINDADSTTLNATWNDGLGSSTTLPLSTTGLFSRTVVYPANGSYTASLRLDDNAGGISTATRSVRVADYIPVPTALLVAQPAQGSAPLTVTFDLGARDFVSPALSYELSFGDSIVSTGLFTRANGLQITHTYTQADTYLAVLVLSDGNATSAFTHTVVTVRTDVNQPPVAENETVALEDDATVTVDLAAITTDADDDPLQWSVETAPNFGTASISGTTLLYTRTGDYIGTDRLTYRADDGRGGRDLGAILVLDGRVTLKISPNAILLTDQIVTNTLQVRAYDAQGRELNLAELGLNLEWVSTQPTTITVRQNATNPYRAEVGSLVDVGSSQVIVRGRNDFLVASQMVPIIRAQPKPGVQTIADVRMIFPPVNATPNSNITDGYGPPDANGNISIGGFTMDEVFYAYNYYTPTDSLTPIMLYPIVIEGAAPAVGTLLVGSESASLMGRVVAVTQRNGRSLVQVEYLEVADVFTTFSYEENTAELFNRGFYANTPYDITAEAEPAPRLARMKPSGDDKPKGGNGDDYAEPLDECKTKFEGPQSGLEVTPPTMKLNGVDILEWGDQFVSPLTITLPFGTSSTTTNTLKFLTGAFALEKGIELNPSNDINAPPIKSAKLIFYFKPKFEAKVGAAFRAKVSASIQCPLSKEFKIQLVPVREFWTGLINLVLSPRLSIQGKSELDVKAEGGPKFDVQFKFTATFSMAVGFSYDMAKGFKNEWFAPDLDKNFKESQLFDGTKVECDCTLDSFKKWKVEVKAGIYMDAKLYLQFGGAAFDAGQATLEAFPPNLRDSDAYKATKKYLDDLAKSAQMTLITARAGVRSSTVWATPLWVLDKQGSYSSSSKLELVLTPKLNTESWNKLLEKYKISNRFPEGLPDDWKVPPLELYKPMLAEGSAHAMQPKFIQDNQPVQFTTFPNANERPWSVNYGEVWYWDDPGVTGSIAGMDFPGVKTENALRVAQLRREGDKLVGSWTPRGFCQELKDAQLVDEIDPKVKFHVLGFNKMWNLNIGPLPLLPEMISTASYLGTVEGSCDDLILDIILPSVITNSPDKIIDPYRPNNPALSEAVWPKEIPLVYACNNRNDPLDVRWFNAQATAEDSEEKLLELKFIFGGHHPPATKPGNGVTTAKLDIGLRHDFGSRNPEYHPVQATAKARRFNYDANGNPTGMTEREKTLHRPFFMKFRQCDDLTQTQFRTIPTFCETQMQERKRTGRRVPVPGGVDVIQFPPWEGIPWYTVSSFPSGICVWFTRSDPHITTIDGLHFDSFSLGEFTYLKPRLGYEQDGVVLQARQQRVGDIVVGSSMIGGTITMSLADWTSWNTAVAFKADNTTVELRAGQLTRPLINRVEQTLTPGLHSFGAVDVMVNSVTSVEIRYKSSKFLITDHWGAWIDIQSTVAQNDSHYGMSGRPNNNVEDDFQWPDGTPALDAYDFANGWRVATAEESLFTYPAGDGPWTYNLLQDAEPPSRTDLAPFMQQAEALLRGACVAENIPEVEIRNVAYELFVGRTPAEIAFGGLCFFYVNGTVTNALVPGLPVPGAKISVLSGAQVVCETWTDRFGQYVCHTPSTGELGTLAVQVSGRGAATSAVNITTLPPAGGYTPLKHDFTVAPTTVQLVGAVTDQTAQPLYNAEVRVNGPTNAGFTTSYTTTVATGQYTTYVMLDDAVLAGDLTYKVTFNPDFRTDPNAATITSVFTRPFSGLTEHALNVVPADLTLTGVMLRFSGRVSYQFDEAVPVQGARVLITPVLPNPEFEACDITTLVYVDPDSLSADRPLDPRKETTNLNRVGTYTCNVPLENLAPFEVRVQVIGRNPAQVVASQTVTVNPAARPAGEVFNIVTPLRVATPVLLLRGVVASPQSQPLAGAVVRISSGEAILDAVAQTDRTGAYSMYLPLDQDMANGTLQYSISYLNVGTSGSATFSGTLLNQPLLVARNWTVRGSKLELAGRVIDTRTNEVVLGSSVIISSPDDPLSCETQTGLHPITPDVYMEPPSPFEFPPVAKTCKRVVGRNSPQAMRVVYDVTTPWEQKTYTDTINLPTVGGFKYVGRDFLTRSITPTLLELSGTVVRPSGAPLVGATVSAAVGDAEASGRTDPTGAYTMALTLPNGVLSGTLDYAVTYRSLSITETAPFNAVQYETTPITNNFLYTPRTVYFRGVITNTYGIDLPPTTVVISSAAITSNNGTRCFTQTDRDGSYVCVAQTTATGPIDLSYTMQGLWGRKTINETATIDGSQDIVEYVKMLSVDLTVLRVVGQVTTPSGTPLAGVEITPSGNDVYRIETRRTDAAGRYDFYVVLRPRTVASWTGDLQYFVGYGEEGRIRRVPFIANTNQSTTLQQDFTLDMRVVTFKGEILNGWVPADRPDKGIVGSRVTISSPTIGALCDYTALDRFNKSTYECNARVFTDQPFGLTYELSGDWGSATFTATLDTLPAPGERLTIERPFTVRPATALLTGRVTDRDGLPLEGIEVKIDADAFASRLVNNQLVRAASLRTTATGWYTSYVVLDEGFTQAALDYRVKYEFDQQTYRLTSTHDLQITPKTLMAYIANFQYPYRKVTFSGTLANASDATVPLDGKLLIVSPSLNRTLCADVEVSTDPKKPYKCEALVDTDQPYLLNYRVTGIWGATNLLNQSANGSAAVITRTLAIQPRLIRLNGRVTAPDGRALANAKIRMTSYSIVNERFTDLVATTDANGFYSVSSVLGDGASQVAIHYVLSVNGSSSVLDTTYTLSPTDLIAAATQDFVVNTSSIKFNGRLFNRLMNDYGAWSADNLLVVSSPTLGRLCATTKLGSAFECTGVVATEQPFDVAYTIFADWGSRVITERVTLVPQFGTNGVWTSTLAITPTMLHLQGTATLTNGVALTPWANATVRTALPGRVSSPLVSSVWSNPNTSANGAFSMYVVLKDVPAVPTSTMSLVFASADAGPYIRQQIYTAETGIINPVAVGNLIFGGPPGGSGDPSTSRTIILRGAFVNALAPNEPQAQPAAYYRLESPTLGTICAYDNPFDPPVRAYYCTATVDNAEPFEVTVYAWGPYGNQNRTFEVQTIPPVGGQATVQEDLNYTPTTVHVTGFIYQPALTPIPVDNVQVEVKLKRGAQIIATKTMRTAPNGLYSFYLALGTKVGAGEVELEFNLDLDGIKTRYTIPGQALLTNQVNEWAYALPFEGRRVRFAGYVTNNLVPGMAAPGTVFITRPNFQGDYCSADINIQTGYYFCDAELDSSDPISVTYRVNGLWGSYDATGFVGTIAGVGSTTLVERNLGVTPTTMRLVGTITDSYGKRLPNVQLEVSGPGFAYAGARGDETVDIITDMQGNYEAFVLLRPNVTRGDLTYQLRYYNINQEYTRSFFGLVLNTLNDGRQNFELDFRNVDFSGRVRNAYAPGIGMVGNISIGSPVEGQLCDVPLDDGSDHANNPELYIGEYQCLARGVTVETIPLTYTVSGDWGTTPLTDAVPFSPVGGTYSKLKNIAATPTSLYLVGTVRDGLGNPMSGATIRVAGNSLSEANPTPIMTTNGVGVYSTTITLKSAVLSGTLLYSINAGDGQAQLNVPFSAQTNQLVNVTQTITFSDRLVDFAGVVANTVLPGTTLNGAAVTINGTGGGTFCATTTSAAGAYQCQVRLLDNQIVPMEYLVGGDWGTSIVSGTIPAAASNTTTLVSTTLTAAPTMLRVRGVVRDEQGVPVAGAAIQITGDAVSSSSGIPVLQTNAQGAYNGTLILKNGRLAGSLNYRVSISGTDGTINVPFTAVANQISELPKDIVFAARTVTFAGRVVNVHVPTMVLPYATVQIGTNGTTLCSPGTNTNGDYSCTVQVVRTSEWAAEYTASGDWGSTTTTGSVPAGSPGSVTSVTQQVSAAPTTLLLRGMIRDGDGAPRAGVTVRVSGAGLSNINSNPLMTTDSAGRYSTAVVLRSGVAAGTLSYRIENGSDVGDVNVTFTAPVNQLTTVNQDVVFTPRTLHFGGTIVNTLVPTMTLPNTQVTIRDLTGTLCSATTTASGAYACSKDIVSAAAFEVEYALSGGWGTMVVTGTVPAASTDTAITRTLAVPVTTLRLHGRVTEPDGTAVPSATITVGNYYYYGLLNTVTATTDANGYYDVYVGLWDRVTSLWLDYRVAAGPAAIQRWRSVNAVNSAIINDVTQDFTLVVNPTTGTFVFTGLVQNELVSGMGLGNATVSISSTSGVALCQNTTWSDGRYSCSAETPTGTPAGLRYAVRGTWGSQIFTRTLTAWPTAGSTLQSDFDLAVRPTTLHLFGALTGVNDDLTTFPLANAGVYISGAGLVETVFVRSDAQGNYSTHGVLRSGVTAGDLAYQVSYNTTTQTFSRSFSGAILNTLNEFQANGQLGQRRIYFNGRVQNALAPERGMGGDLRVRNASGTEICDGYIYGDGSYYCYAYNQPTEPFTVTYHVSSDWGGGTTTGTVPAGVVGDQTSVAKTISFSATTLRLVGRLFNATNQSLAGASISITSNDFAWSNSTAYATTDANGLYTTTATLKTGAVAGALVYTIAYQSGRGSVNGTYTASANQLTTTPKNIEFNARSLYFNGSIVNTLVPTMTLPYGNMKISAPNIGQLCDTGSYNSYSCSAQVSNTEAFSVTYTYTAPWGTSVMTGTVAAGSNGSSTTTTKPIAIAPTTLRLVGQVRNQAGPVTGRYVQVDAANVVAYSNYDYVDAAGRYEIYLIANANAQNSTLRYYTYDNIGSLYNYVPVSLVPNTLNTISHDMVLDFRTFQFSGSVANATLPSWPNTFYGTRITVSSPSLGELCSDYLYSETAYSCNTTVAVAAIFPVVYTLSGEWGTTIITATDAITALPAIGGTLPVVRNLSITPTMVRLTGLVNDANGQPVPNAYVSYSSDDHAYDGGSTSGYTDSTGRYTFDVIVKSNVPTPYFTYYVSGAGQDSRDGASITVVPGTLNTVTQDFNLGRYMYFDGALINTVVPTATVYSNVIIKSPVLGELCNTGTRTTYSCYVPINTAEPFQAIYTLSYDWGTTTYTRTVANLPVAGGVATTFSSDLAIAPTMLRLEGIISTPTGEPLDGVTLEVWSGTSISSAGDTRAEPSDAAGRYTLDVVLRTDQLSGTINYRMYRNNLYIDGQMTYSGAQNGRLKIINTPLTFAKRRITFTGTLRNSVIAGMPINNTLVAITSPTLGQVCSTYTNSNGAYTCDFDSNNAAPFAVNYAVSRDWGSAAFTGTVAIIPQAGSVGQFTRDLTITVTTLRLTGTLRNPDGSLAVNRSVYVSGTRLSDGTPSTSVQTDITGVYTFNLVLDTGTTVGNLTLTAYPSNVNNWVQNTVAYTVQAGLLNQQTHNIVYTALHLTGTVRTTGGALRTYGYVQVTSPNIQWSTYDYYSTDGRYDFYVVAKEGITSGTLNYSVYDYNTRTSTTVAQPFNVPANQTTAIPLDFSY